MRDPGEAQASCLVERAAIHKLRPPAAQPDRQERQRKCPQKGESEGADLDPQPAEGEGVLPRAGPGSSPPGCASRRAAWPYGGGHHRLHREDLHAGQREQGRGKSHSERAGPVGYVPVKPLPLMDPPHHRQEPRLILRLIPAAMFRYRRSGKSPTVRAAFFIPGPCGTAERAEAIARGHLFRESLRATSPGVVRQERGEEAMAGDGGQP